MLSRCTVELYGWNEGFQTIDMMKLIRAKTGMQLGDALKLVNRVLDGATESLDFPDMDEAKAFLRDALKTGVKARLEGGNDP
jgi:hypothetical protein